VRPLLIGLILCAATPGVRAQPTPSAESAPVKAAGPFHRYKDARGRFVYTNIAEQVPLAQRDAALVDLGKVSLNLEIGNELARRLQQEHAALTQTPFCERLREAAATPFADQLFGRYAPLLIAAGVLVVLLLVSPAAMRRFGAQGWTKALGLAIPMVVACGLVVFSIDKTRESVARLRERARPCMPGALAALGGESGALQKHAELVDRLKRDMAAIDAESGRR
jgi:hypothetical protein